MLAALVQDFTTTLLAFLGVFSPLIAFLTYQFINAWLFRERELANPEPCHWCGKLCRSSRLYRVKMSLSWKHPQPACWFCKLNYRLPGKRDIDIKRWQDL